MTYLLDTNAAIALIAGRPPSVRQRLLQLETDGEADLATSSIVLFELWFGVARSARRKENAERLRVFLSGGVSVLPFQEEDAAIAGELRAVLARAGTPIGPYDLLIAAQSRRAGMTLVTANVSEFSRVPGLSWEDWTALA